MTESPAPRPKRRLLKYFLIASLLSVLLFSSLAWYVTTDSFQTMILRRVVSELERVSGGRVELASMHTVPFRLQVEMRGLTIHGNEPANDIPYVHVSNLIAQIKIISLLEARFGFASVILDQPVLHVIVYPDGKTNQPQPHLSGKGKSPVEELFSLSISDLQVRHGELLWADQRIPLDFRANDVYVDMTHSVLRRRYETNVLLGKVDTIYQSYRPVAWTAEAHFYLGQNYLELQSLKLTSGRSHVQAKGRVEDFRQPKIDADYDLTVDLAEAAAVVHRREVRRGLVHATGRGSWSAQTFSSAGQLALNGFDWRTLPVGLHDVDLDTRFSLDPQHLSLSQIQAQVFGGSVTGDADVSGWQGTLAARKLPPAMNVSEPQGTVRLRLKDLKVGDIAAALSTSARPFSRVKLAAAASGTMDTRWRGSPRNAEIALAVDLAPPSKVLSSQLPVTARIRGTYRPVPDELTISELTANTRATQVRASGTLSTSASLKLSITTTDLAEWQPVLVAAGYDAPVPVTLHGSASFAGIANGKLSDIAFTGNLQSQGFDVLIPASSEAPERLTHWDSLATDIRLSSRVFALRNARLLRANTNLNADLRIRLDQRKLTDSSTFRLQAELDDADVTELFALAGRNYPVTGAVKLHLLAQGTIAQPEGEGHVQLTNAVIYGAPIRNVDWDMQLSQQEAEFNNIHLLYYDARVAGQTAYNLATHDFHFQLTGTNFDLARIARLQTSRVAVEGRVDFSASGSGTPEQPAIQATVNVRDLTLDHERAGNFTLKAASQGSEVKLTGESQFEHANLELAGGVQVHDDWPADVTLHFNHLDVDSLLRTYVRGHITGHSAVEGDVRVQGPLKNLRELRVSGNLTGLAAQVEGIDVSNNGPLLFSVSRQSFNLEQFHLVGQNTDFSASGNVQLSGDRPLSLHAQGQVNLKLIQSLDPDFTSSGVLTMDTNVSGTAAKPVLQGRVKLESGNVAYLDMPTALSDINGSLVFNQDRLQIENLTAHMGGGLVSLSGYLSSYNRQLNFSVGVQGQGIRLRYPPGISSTGDLDLNFIGNSTSATLSGNIVVTRLGMTPGFDFGGYLQRSLQTSTLPSSNPMLNSVHLDVHVTSVPELQMQTVAVRLSGDADLRVRGTAARPVILGRADIVEGWVNFSGTKYTLERGDITFTNPVTTTPTLDLQASTQVHDYDITLNLTGSIDKPSVTYRSEPPLPPGDIISLLAFGQTAEESAQLQQSNQSAFSQAASSALINAALNSTVGNRVQRLFGVSRIKIDPQGLVTETSPTQTGPAVTIEQQVKNNLTVTYTTNVAQSSQQIIQVEYNLTRSVSIVALRDLNGVVSIDVRFRKRKK